MTDAAGTTDLSIKQTVKDTKGNVLYTVETKAEDLAAGKKLTLVKIEICITKISTFLILCDLAVCLATLYVSFSLVLPL